MAEKACDVHQALVQRDLESVGLLLQAQLIRGSGKVQHLQAPPDAAHKRRHPAAGKVMPELVQQVLAE
ncbi:MAG: hypothetical protein FJX25_08920 [Alphaproteobacteria bacterium]|nr:hypothetical protein [Alphaproteobacteria bacterium]